LISHAGSRCSSRMTACFPDGCPDRLLQGLASGHCQPNRTKQLNPFQEEEIPWQRNQPFR
jgi:hypothetical protein